MTMKKTMKSLLGAGLFALAMSLMPAKADNLVADLSENIIAITSNFSGKQLVLFGAIDRSATSLTEDPDVDGLRDIIVVIRGPNRPVMVRRKERVAGIWVNTQNIEFDGVPGYYFVAASRAFEDVAPPAVYRRLQIRPRNLRMNPKNLLLEVDQLQAYREAIIRNKQKADLFFEEPGGVKFLDKTLFRATVKIPANVPVGRYKTEVYLLRDGEVIGIQSKALSINKTGIERSIYEFAYDSPFAYGLLAVLFALMAGGIGSLLFRER